MNFCFSFMIFDMQVEARLKDVKSQLGDLATTYPKPEHEGQFITQQSSFQVKEDTEDQRQTP